MDNGTNEEKTDLVGAGWASLSFFECRYNMSTVAFVNNSRPIAIDESIQRKKGREGCGRERRTRTDRRSDEGKREVK